MKKIVFILATIAFTLAMVSTLQTANGNSISSDQDQSYSMSGDSQCGYGAKQLGQEYCPNGYVPCLRPTGILFREVGVCSTITGGGCIEDECKDPCYRVYP